MSPIAALDLDETLYEKRKELIQMMLPKDLDVSDPISREVFMLDGNKKGVKPNK